MPTHETVRLTLHCTSDPLVFAWSLLALFHDSRGVPHARLVDHGTVDLQNPDPVGIEVVAALLARATRQEV